ncbi:YkvA family protein [Pusillimonas sp. SM2304]|uniref:YkvA family protein n=1 Tax=Pusillimonas sp. SM2304 TaxID=3073241 RepID=UPI00287549FA|nr:YkvA family protein [Pusillimonas sp. SM2304]MDS1139880.1 YkvA family protein [Pusillimonas sp. SM2304]
MNSSRYQSMYTPARFWQKLGPRARSASRTVVEKALYLYYAVQSANTPKWAKRVIYGALGYFIFPLDAIPDLAPLVGYTDDLSVMAAALATVAFYITPDVKAQAHRKLDEWFDTPAGRAHTDA